MDEFPNNIKMLIIGLIAANIISKEGEVLISEEAIWDIFGDCY